MEVEEALKKLSWFLFGSWLTLIGLLFLAWLTKLLIRGVF